MTTHSPDPPAKPGPAAKAAAARRRPAGQTESRQLLLLRPRPARIADAEYDKLLRELTDLETAHPELVTADLPTQRVGASPQSDFKPHTHRQPMLSLANAFNDDELRAFDEKIKRHLGLAGDAAVDYVAGTEI